MTLPDTYRTQSQFIQESPKFQLQPDGSRVAIPFPGYSIITTPWAEVAAEAEKSKLYASLQTCQQQLLEQLTPGLLVPVPADSFHVTLADLIWDSAYRDALTSNPTFEENLQQAIAQIFQSTAELVKRDDPIRLQVLGLAIMPRALAICLAPTEEQSYIRLTQFRRSIYQTPELVTLGIEQQYGFTAHITLGYFGSVAPDRNHEKVCDILTDLNQQWLGTPQIFAVQQAELRKFDDMTHYYRRFSSLKRVRETVKGVSGLGILRCRISDKVRVD
jgi:hypothetical protein